jgi:thiamine pyrophosphate-dependent acetolactate synthase large subunit-like protein
MNGGDRIADVLAAHGVRFVFTLCGGHISPILVGAKKRGIRIIDVRHEADAVFAADAVARMTGVPGVAAVTAGPGVTNTITAIKNAQLAQSPLLVLGGATATLLRGRGALQDIDQMALIEPHVKWAVQARSVRQLSPLLTEGFRRAQSGVPGPVFIECPVDLLYDEALVREWYAAATRGGGLAGLAQKLFIGQHLARLFAGRPGAAEVLPLDLPESDASTLGRVASRLRKAERPVFVLGSQTVGGGVEVDALVEAVTRLGVPVYLAGGARGLIPAESGLAFRHRRKEALREADVVLLAGIANDFRLDYGRQVGRRATLIMVNRSMNDLTLNRRPQIGVQADPGRFLIALATRWSAPESGSGWNEWRRVLSAREAEREAQITEQAAVPAELVNPLTLCKAVDAHLADDSVLIADGGDFVATAAYTVRPRRPLSWLDPGVFGTLGVGGGFALGAKLSRPGADVWIIYGDGSVAYSLAEFDAFVRHNLPVIAVVGNDAGWTQIAREQVAVLHDDVGTVLARSDYHTVAEGYGGKGLLLKRQQDIPTVLAEALRLSRAGSPVLINAWIDKTEFRKGSISM